MKPMVSVIVPVYKVEDCLKRCLDSLYVQRMKEIEIIMVDDASPDSCGELCEEYAAKDPRFKAFHHDKNKGLSEARNTGIQKANADFLMFVDSDDYVNNNFCYLPYHCAVKYQSDLVLFRHVVEKSGFSINRFFKKVTVSESGYVTKTEALDLLNNCVGQVAWNKLYRKSLFYNISYPPRFNYEDWGTTYKTVLKASNIYFLDKVLYCHCFRKGSISSTRSEKNLKDRFAMMLQQYQDLSTWGGCSSEKLDNLLYNIAISYCIRSKRNWLDSNYVFCADIINNCNRIPKSFNFNRKVLFLLYKYSPSLFDLICNFWGKKYG